MEILNVDVKLDQTININIEIDDVIDSINDLIMKKRWNYVSKIINEVQLNSYDLTDEQKAIIKKYLSDKLLLF